MASCLKLYILFTFSIKTSIYMVFTTVVIYMGGIWLDKIITDSNAYLTANKASMSKEEKKHIRIKQKEKETGTSCRIAPLFWTTCGY